MVLLFFRTLLHEGLKGKFLTSCGFDGWLLTNGTIGMAPSSLKDLLMQITTMGLARLIMWGHIQYFASIVRNCYKKREISKKID